MSLSHTDMALRLTPRRNIGLAGDVDLSTPDAAEAWIMSLPPEVRGTLQSRLKAIALSLPGAAQIDLANAIVNSGHELAVQLPLNGLGCSCDEGANGLGQWGALLTGLTGALTTVIAADLTGKSNKDIAKNAAATNAAIAKAQADAAAATQKIIADAQVKAAAERAPIIKQAIMWGGISVTLIAGLTALYLIRKSRKK